MYWVSLDYLQKLQEISSRLTLLYEKVQAKTVYTGLTVQCLWHTDALGLDHQNIVKNVLPHSYGGI